VQAQALEKWLLWIATEFQDRLLPVDEQGAEQWGRLGLHQPVPVLDALLAATAPTHGFTMVSRNDSGFRNTGVLVINPF
jgi:predicted nucleic acid-binding protein